MPPGHKDAGFPLLTLTLGKKQNRSKHLMSSTSLGFSYFMREMGINQPFFADSATPLCSLQDCVVMPPRETHLYSRTPGGRLCLLF
jgi:hypothetical protein